MTVVVCRPSNFPVRRIHYCPTEDRHRRMAGYVALRYGQTLTCLGCGDSWTDGEQHERPLRPRWRKEAIASAREAWDAALGLTNADYRTWFRAEMAGAA